MQHIEIVRSPSPRIWAGSN